MRVHCTSRPRIEPFSSIEDGRLAGTFCCTAYVALWQIVLQKSPSGLCEIEICNYRIEASVLLHRCCAFQPDLESIFSPKCSKSFCNTICQQQTSVAYSITSSASASNVGGMPTAIGGADFDGGSVHCKSAGFSPLRKRSTHRC